MKYIDKVIENTCSDKNLDMNIHSSFINMSPKVARAQISLAEWYTASGIARRWNTTQPLKGMQHGHMLQQR